MKTLPESNMTTNIPTLDDLLDESNWLEWRESALKPASVTTLTTSDQFRHEFVTGWQLMPKVSARTPLPHQLVAADMLNTGAETNGICLPRRSTKTTSTLALVLGRCAIRDGYQAVMTLTTKAATTSARFRSDILRPLELKYPDKNDRPVKLGFGKGDEHLAFSNGSFFAAHSPNPDSFRSGGFDFLLIDESGEAEPEQAALLIDAIMPTLDVQTGDYPPQVAFIGTAGKYRKGNLLWEALEDPDAGHLVYGAPDTTTDADLSAWEPTPDEPEGQARELIELWHPGVKSGITTVEKMEARYRKQSPESFGREYLSIFGTGSAGAAVVDLDAWSKAGTDAALPTVPDHFGFAFATHPLERTSCLAIAWRDEDGKAYLGITKHSRGTAWVSEEAYGISRRLKVGIAYDRGPLPATLREAENLERASPPPRMVPLSMQNIKVAASRLVEDVRSGKVVHFNDPGLNLAAEQAVKRKIGVGYGWGFGPSGDDSDITPLEAVSYALHAYDNAVKPVRIGAYVVT